MTLRRPDVLVRLLLVALVLVVDRLVDPGASPWLGGRVAGPGAANGPEV